MHLNIFTDIDARFYEVFCNGEKLEDCFSADEEKGEAWVYVRQNGHLIWNGYGEVMIDWILGNIEIRDTRSHNSD
jgi:hypothetical protein